MRPDLLRINEIRPRIFVRDPRISHVFLPSKIQSTYGVWISNPLGGVARIPWPPLFVIGRVTSSVTQVAYTDLFFLTPKAEADSILRRFKHLAI